MNTKVYIALFVCFVVSILESQSATNLTVSLTATLTANHTANRTVNKGVQVTNVKPTRSPQVIVPTNSVGNSIVQTPSKGTTTKRPTGAATTIFKAGLLWIVVIALSFARFV
jgi:hypothetical protein